MMFTMRTLALLAVTAALVVAAAITTGADQKAFLGRWNLTGTGTDSNAIFWLEVKEENGQLSGMFLNRGGSPVKLASVEVKDDELIITTAAPEGRPGQTFRAKRKGTGLEGSTTVGERTLEFTGARPPSWPAANANATHTYGKPVELFDGKSLDTWNLQIPNRPSGWSVVDGAMTNEAKANNLVSKQTFKDFKIQAEYRIESGSNSGIYLRGRYELQVLDDFGKEPEPHGHMAIYAWVAPRVNASKPASEWQVMEAVLVGNKVTVTLNGQKVHDNATIQAITGGTLDANETQPGPIMLQGDHGKVWYRKVTVTPIVKAGT
jgi:3-keto-disaccharide hydrolase